MVRSIPTGRVSHLRVGSITHGSGRIRSGQEFRKLRRVGSDLVENSRNFYSDPNLSMFFTYSMCSSVVHYMHTSRACRVYKTSDFKCKLLANLERGGTVVYPHTVQININSAMTLQWFPYSERTRVQKPFVGRAPPGPAEGTYNK